MRINEIEQYPPLGKRMKFNFFDVFAFVKDRGGKLSIGANRNRPAEVRNRSGVYLWSHPDFGYFYVGIASRDNVMQRWNAHTQKLLDTCSTAKQMKNWKAFSDRFTGAGYGRDDLKDITLHFFPIASKNDFEDLTAWKNYLKRLEARINTLLNPACNAEHKPERPSSTRYPEYKAKLS
jgi:hypothetical protein